jgi:hypothetical protein
VDVTNHQGENLGFDPFLVPQPQHLGEDDLDQTAA